MLKTKGTRSDIRRSRVPGFVAAGAADVPQYHADPALIQTARLRQRYGMSDAMAEAVATLAFAAPDSGRAMP